MKKKSKPTNLSLEVSENIDTKENLTNNKPWFNGLKKFSSVKVLPIRKDSGRDKSVKEP